jgi:ankyrin repeat protein
MDADALFTAQLTPQEWFGLISSLIIEGDDEKLSFWMEHLIVSGKIDVNVPLRKNTWLIRMVASGNPELVRLLLRYGANVQLGTTPEGTTPIVKAVMLSGVNVDASKKSDIIKLLVENDRTILTTRVRGKHILQYCYESYQIDGFDHLSLLLDLGFDINMKNCDVYQGQLSNYSMIFWAAYENNYELFNFLIARGANPNDRADFSDSPIGFSRVVESKSLLHFITTRVRPVEDKRRLMNKLLSAGADVDEGDVSGRTCLWHMVYQCQVPLCDLLLQYGANPHKRCHMQYGNSSPLDHAQSGLKNHILQVIRDRRDATVLALHSQGVPPDVLYNFVMPHQ